MTLKLQVLGANQTEVSLNEAEANRTNKRILFSYNTPVAAWVFGVGYIRTDKRYSVTTSKHINLWLDGNVAKSVPQSEIDALLS